MIFGSTSFGLTVAVACFGVLNAQDPPPTIGNSVYCGSKGSTTYLRSLNDLRALNSSCRLILGSLVLQGPDFTKDLAALPLPYLRAIEGSLEVFETQLESFSNVFGNLSRVGQSLSIHDNKALKNLEGLQALTSIRQKLEIYENPSLSTLKGLRGLNVG